MGPSMSVIQAYLSTWRVPPVARDFILATIKDLSRDVSQSSFPKVVTEHQSEKMGQTVNTESATGELAFSLHLDFDDQVIAYYEQLPPLDCFRHDKNGKLVLRTYRADFLVLHAQYGPTVVQVKQQSAIDEKVEKYPMDWIERDGRIVDLPAEKACEKIGLRHTVVSSRDLPQVRVSNLRLLLIARRTMPDEPSDTELRVERFMKGVTADNIISVASHLGIVNLTPVLHTILRRHLFVDIDGQLIGHPESCLISTSPVLIREAREATRGYPDGTNGPIPVSRLPPRVQAEKALKNLELLKEQPKSRTARHLRKKIRDSPDQSAFLAVCPRTYLSGNRLPKRPDIVLRVAQEALEEHWANKERPGLTTAYRQYKNDAKAAHPEHARVSIPTWNRLALQTKQTAAEARGGIKMRNAAASPTCVDDRQVLATRPFERAQIDHCLLKLHCVLLRTEDIIYTARPWLSVLVDCYTQEPLGFWLSFRHPKRRALAMAIRSCVRRYGRAPEEIGGDGGPDLKSVYLSQLAAHYGMDLHLHPFSNPKFASSVEGFHSRFTSVWLDSRPGNITKYRQARAVSGSHKPDKYATIDLVQCLYEVQAYCDWYAAHLHGDQDLSPFILREEGLARFPDSGIRIALDQEFLIASSVDEKDYSFDPARGIKIGVNHYWHPALRDPHILRTKLAVRPEPEDCGCVYVRVNDQWVTCRSGKSPALAAMQPFDRVARSLLVMDGSAEREAAKDEADRALVVALRMADERIAEAQTPASNGILQENITDDDMWAEIRVAALKGLTSSTRMPK